MAVIDRQLAKSWGYSDQEIDDFMKQYPAKVAATGSGNLNLGVAPVAPTVPDLSQYASQMQEKKKKAAPKVNLSAVGNAGVLGSVPGATQLPQGGSGNNWLGAQIAGMFRAPSIEARTARELGLE